MTARVLHRVLPPSGHDLPLQLAATTVLALAFAFAIAHGRGAEVSLALLVAVGVIVGLQRWRWSIYGLLLYIPFSGLPAIATYPDNTAAVLLKDLVFVIPAYIGFANEQISRRKRTSFDGAPVRLLGLFALLVILQALNPALPNRLVGAIGVKVWLFYVPMLFLGYHLVRERRDVFRLLALMSWVAIVPAVIGIAEAALISGGHAQEVYNYYGDAAAAATQNFAETGYVGGGALRRIPSTFTFITQYYTFIASMIAVSYAWWRGSRPTDGRRYAPALIWLLMLAAGFLSGSRGAFLFIPLLVLLIVLLERGRLQFPVARIAAPVLAFLAAASVIGAQPVTVFGHAVEAATNQFTSVFLDGARYAFHTSMLGLGTGIDTGASRRALPDMGRGDIVGRGQESWYIKAWLELGIAGLVIVVLLLAVLIARGLRNHRALQDPGLRVVSACIVAFLIWNAIYNLKAIYIDLDPINIYFWLFAGLMFKLRPIDRALHDSGVEPAT